MNFQQACYQRRLSFLGLVLATGSALVFLMTSVRYPFRTPVFPFADTEMVSMHQFLSSDVILTFQDGSMSVDAKGPHLEDLTLYIQQKLVGPSHKPLNLTDRDTVDFSQADQSTFVDGILGHLQGGFFVEVGAADGESFSNTLYLEKVRSWTGLLIEANPQIYSELLCKHRNVFSINACLSPSSRPQVMEFKSVGLYGGLSDSMDASHKKGVETMRDITTVSMVQCFPLSSILQALGYDHITYLSLDVEGPELDILASIPWTKLRIDVISVEYKVWDGNGTHVEASLEKLGRIRDCIAATGLYTEAAILPIRGDVNVAIGGLEKFGLDVVFQRLDLTV